jgi:hypothetical protein
VSRTAGRTHVTYSCSGMERLVPSSWSSPAPEIFVHFSPGAARHSRSAGGRHGFTAAQANGSHPELYKLHCSKLSRGGRLAGRPRSWRQTNASVDERHCRQSSHCQIARSTTLHTIRSCKALWNVFGRLSIVWGSLKLKVRWKDHIQCFSELPFRLANPAAELTVVQGFRHERPHQAS